MRSFLTAVVVVAVALPASAEPTSGTIVRIEGYDLVVDLAAPEGTLLAVYRNVEVRHPVTQEVLRDRFPLGRARVMRSGGTLSVVQLVGESEPVQVGDVVERFVAQAPPIVPTAPPPLVVAMTPAPTTDPEVEGILAAWRMTLGKSPAGRIRVYEAYLAERPESRFAPLVRTEVDALRAATARRESPEAREARALVLARHGGVLRRAREGREVEVAIVLSGAQPRALQLHARRDGSDAYGTWPMPMDARGHARAAVPASIVRAPGLEYFVDAIPEDGRPVAVLGSATSPVVVDVEPPPNAEEGRRSSVHVGSELVSFDRFSGRDWYFLQEGDFLYRTNLPGLEGARVGYGAYRGEGGTVEALDVAGAAPTPAAFTYGYLEPTIAFSRYFAVLPRGEVGVGRPTQGADDAYGLGGGFRLGLRMGREEGTHLDLAGETVPEIGQSAELGLAWRTLPRVPMAAEIHVTDQPVNSDEVAVRLVYEVGVRPTDWLALASRLSYQGRTIDHAGFGAGLGATVDW